MAGLKQALSWDGMGYQQLRVSVPLHKGQTLGRGITLAIIKDAGIITEEFLKLL